MKLSIGYQLPDKDDSIYEIARDYQSTVSGVYFPMAGRASARTAIGEDYEAIMVDELKTIRALGVRLTLLYNANCYGDDAISSSFKQKIIVDVKRMDTQLGLHEIITTSPFVARVIKENFPHLRVTASVNMWIGTTQAMDYLADDFDGFYLQREFNRDFERIRRLKDWCDEHGKMLKLLGNSGCLYSCSFHTFHDNLVAHEAMVSQGDNAFSNNPSPCWDYMEGKNHIQAAATFLRGNWVRPEDVKHYEPYFDEIKLATRMHSTPRRVIMAYARGRFHGNLMDLTEPAYSRLFPAHILDATKCPSDWFEQTSSCGHHCESCSYCQNAAGDMLVTKTSLEKEFVSG